MIKKGLRIAFAGTPELAAVILSSLIEIKEHQVVFVITQPDRPAGRGRKLVKSPVKILAEKEGIDDIRQPEKPVDLDPGNELSNVDVLIVAAYGMILPKNIIDRPRFGSINVHTSLLPRWRGAAPIQRAIQAGDNNTGITIIQLDAGLDSGDILLQKECPIDSGETAGSLHDKLAQLGSECLLLTLKGLVEGSITPVKQDPNLVTYARKISKTETSIDWNMAATDIETMIRAFNPAPIAHTSLNGLHMRIWQSAVVKHEHASPGTVISADSNGIMVATASDALLITKLQLPGKNVVQAGDFLNGHPDFLSAGIK